VSCWECKRRKVRCTFASPEDTVCSNCHRRKSVCVSQELPEELAPARIEPIGNRIDRVEELVHNLAKQYGAASGSSRTGPSSTLSEVSVPTPAYTDPELGKSRDADRTRTVCANQS
jgi:hypothetical protein